MDSRVSRAEQRDVALLTSEEAGELLRTALGEDARGLASWSVHSVHHRPGAGVSAGYAVRFATAAGTVEEYVVATTARITAPASGVLARLEDGDRVVHLWRHPADPELPALADATVPHRLGAVLGLNRSPSIELLTYRPLRRAVVRARSADLPAGEVYVKVVRPAAVDEIVRRHQMLSRAGVPAAHCVHHTPEGLVVLAPGQGVPLAGVLAAGPDRRQRGEIIEGIVAMLDRLPVEAMLLSRRPSWTDRWGHYAHAATTAVPELGERIAAVAQRIQELMLGVDPGPEVPAHGDLYEANLLVTGSAVTAVLDVDSVGPGYRADDLACLLAHVSVLPHVAPGTYPNVREILADWTARCAELVDPMALRARCAGVALSLVAGARREGVARGRWLRDAEGRLSEAEGWLSGT